MPNQYDLNSDSDAKYCKISKISSTVVNVGTDAAKNT